MGCRCPPVSNLLSMVASRSMIGCVGRTSWGVALRGSVRLAAVVGYAVFSNFWKCKVTQHCFAAQATDLEKIRPDDLFVRYAAPNGYFLIMERLIEYFSLELNAAYLLINHEIQFEII